MVKGDGDISPWLEAQEASTAGLSIGFKQAPGWPERFARSLDENPDAGRLRDLLPKCHPLLAAFIMLVVTTNIEDRLLELTRNRGDELIKILRPAARKQKSGEAREVMLRASRAFDTRRQGLAQSCFGALIIRRYIQFRTGVAPSARELAALLKAGLAACGRPPFQQMIDHDLLRRNLQNYERKHPHPLLTGERSAQIIECSLPEHSA